MFWCRSLVKNSLIKDSASQIKLFKKVSVWLVGTKSLKDEIALGCEGANLNITLFKSTDEKLVVALPPPFTLLSISHTGSLDLKKSGLSNLLA